MAKKTNWALSAIEPTAVPDSLTSGLSKPTLNQDRWSEDFQDLSGYCNIGSKMTDNSGQQLVEQLNTPNIIVQEEFNYNDGLRSSGDRFGSFEEIDPWGAQNDNKTDTSHTELWGDVSDWLRSNNQQDINDQEDMVSVGVDIDAADETDFHIATEENQLQLHLPQQQHLISSDRDVLLSQSSDYEQQQTLPIVHQIQDQPHIDVMLLKPEPQYYDQNSSAYQQHQLISMKNINNNNDNVINMNSVLSSNSNNLQIKSQRQEQRNSSEQSKTKLKSAFVNGNTKNHRDTKYNFNSIIKSEEPLIGVSNKRMSSCSTLDNSNNIIITTVSSINPVSSVDAVKLTTVVSLPKSNDSNNSIEYIIPEPIKTEPVDSTDKEVETINNKHTNDSVVRRGAGKQFKLPTQNSKKTGLRLDIDSAARLVTSVNTPTTTPTTSIAANCDITSTPEVLRPLYNSTGFDLLSYISGDGAGDGLSSPSVFAAGDNDSPVIDSRRNIAIIKPVQQPKKSKAVIVEKCEQLFELPVVKEEEEVIKKEEDDSLDPCDESVSMRTTGGIDDSTSTPPERVTARRTTSRRRRAAKKSDDMESDLSNLSDFMEEDDEKHDKTFTLTTPYRRKRTISNTSRTSTELSRSSERYPYYGKQRKLSRDTDSSDHDSIASTVDRYRELRDRNNEASRRSRLNRKSRELEMKQQAIKLEEENKRLKAKADEMERLVKRLREGLMQLVLKKR